MRRQISIVVAVFLSVALTSTGCGGNETDVDVEGTVEVRVRATVAAQTYGASEANPSATTESASASTSAPTCTNFAMIQCYSFQTNEPILASVSARVCYPTEVSVGDLGVVEVTVSDSSKDWDRFDMTINSIEDAKADPYDVAFEFIAASPEPYEQVGVATGAPMLWFIWDGLPIGVGEQVLVKLQLRALKPGPGVSGGEIVLQLERGSMGQEQRALPLEQCTLTQKIYTKLK